MQTRPLILTALVACMSMTAACAPFVPRSVATQATTEARPPRLETPAWMRQPCRLALLPAGADQAAYDLTFAARGEQLVDCDTVRAASIDLRDREHAAQDAWWRARECRRLSAWRRLLSPCPDETDQADAP